MYRCLIIWIWFPVDGSVEDKPLFNKNPVEIKSLLLLVLAISF